MGCAETEPGYSSRIERSPVGRDSPNSHADSLPLRLATALVLILNRLPSSPATTRVANSWRRGFFLGRPRTVAINVRIKRIFSAYLLVIGVCPK